MMQMNHTMRTILDERQILYRIDELGLEPGLASLLSSRIMEIKGCYFLQALIPDGFDIEEALKSAFDQTEIECDINHIHVNEYLDQPVENDVHLIRQGVRYAFLLQTLLPKTVDFKVIFACTYDPFIDCNIRFHKKRFGEDWVADNLDNYEEAVLLLDRA
jgi:hypothetical protein